MLTPKQERFCQEYIVDLNASAAARRAGYSHRTAGSIGEELLRKPEISARIRELKDEQARRTQITADQVLAELARIAYLDPRKLFHPDGSLRSIQELDEDTARAIAAIDIEERLSGRDLVTRTIKRIKLWNKVEALDRLARHFGLFTDRLELGGKLAVTTMVPLEEMTDEQLAEIASRGSGGTAPSSSGAS
ncbi:terminase small subunit [Tuwongella immobilis]|uniref:Terminase small subunit n=1 Tax=Tuwongella immobilis TaxID=692036 RepID=A0A6C2YM49_9BACT|nr:terminase small subunit [Tuwongella immobilis]VIP02155.1 terminase small subunit : Terminase small subunit OS=Burkholderia multivorans CGD2 GN=BURMUCGD2_1201 PE=4 SV=1: Terminase_2 [Tuwongella immobilis]VTS00552.1 terminase small subunit : Terminase small subunit OS=Burkholderia multivorans CGD2 GN=BURMUCGD2_1201 PE=4 SV=1: Terminase_2 [Tuwongella immobilis]